MAKRPVSVRVKYKQQLRRLQWWLCRVWRTFLRSSASIERLFNSLPETTMIVYRKATTADQEAIWQVRTASIRTHCRSHYSEMDVEAWASVPRPNDFAEVICNSDFQVAESKDTVVGFGFINRDTAVLEAIFVDPHFARQGIGRQLLTSLEAIARHVGLKSLKLSASLNAMSFYESAGYQAIQETTWHHPAGFSLPCLEMFKSLSADGEIRMS